MLLLTYLDNSFNCISLFTLQFIYQNSATIINVCMYVCMFIINYTYIICSYTYHLLIDSGVRDVLCHRIYRQGWQHWVEGGGLEWHPFLLTVAIFSSVISPFRCKHVRRCRHKVLAVTKRGNVYLLRVLINSPAILILLHAIAVHDRPVVLNHWYI